MIKVCHEGIRYHLDKSYGTIKKRNNIVIEPIKNHHIGLQGTNPLNTKQLI